MVYSDNSFSIGHTPLVRLNRVKAGLRRAKSAGTKLGRPTAAFDVNRTNQNQHQRTNQPRPRA